MKNLELDVDGLKDVQRRHYDGVSDNYARKIDEKSYTYYFDFTQKAILDALDRHLGDIASRRGLDLGCGVGDFTAAIGRECREMVGADISPGMIGVAQRVHSQSNLSFVASSAEQIDFSAGQFDFTMSVHLFHHLIDEELVASTLANMKRLTRNGGLIVVVDVNKLNPTSRLVQHLMVKRGVDTGLERLVAPREITGVMKSLGVEVLSHRGFCFIPHVVPWLAGLDPICGKIFPDRFIGKDYIVVGRVVD